VQRAVNAHLSGERIDYGVHRSSCAFDSAVRDILGRVRSAPRHVRCRSDGPRLDSANRHGHPENDRKERFHGTKYSSLMARARLPDRRRDCAANRRFQLNKRSRLFIGAHNETLSFATMRVNDFALSRSSKGKCFALTHHRSLITYHFP